MCVRLISVIHDYNVTSIHVINVARPVLSVWPSVQLSNAALQAVL